MATGEELPTASFVFGPDTGEPPAETPPLVEIAVSEATAAAIGVAVGDELVGSVDPTDPLVPGTPDQPLRARFERDRHLRDR